MYELMIVAPHLWTACWRSVSIAALKPPASSRSAAAARRSPANEVCSSSAVCAAAARVMSAAARRAVRVSTSFTASTRRAFSSAASAMAASLALQHHSRLDVLHKTVYSLIIKLCESVISHLQEDGCTERQLKHKLISRSE